MLFIIIIASIACVVLVLFILAQNPKGGGLSSTFGGATQIIGARQTADFLEKASWYLAVGILALVLLSNAFKPSASATQERESKMQSQIETLPTQIPQNPNQTQAQQQAQQQGSKQNQAPAAKKRQGGQPFQQNQGNKKQTTGEKSNPNPPSQQP